MMGHIKRILGFTHRTRPVTMKDVDPAPQDPEMERRIRAARTGLVTDLMKMERSSWELRQALATRTLRLVVKGRQGDRHDEDKE